MRIVSVAFLLLTFAIGTLFIHVPHIGQIGFLLKPMMIDSKTGELIEIKLSYNQYFYLVCEHFIACLLAWIIWDVSEKYKRIAGWYLVILLMDFIVWFLSYNDPLKGYIITWNIFKTLLFISAIAFELWKTRRTLKEG